MKYKLSVYFWKWN